MIRRQLFAGLAALALLAVGQSAQAGFNNFSGGLPITFGGAITSDTGNINTATMFSLPPLYYFNGAGSGDFATYLNPLATPTVAISPASTMSGLNPNGGSGYVPLAPGTFSFGNSVFGTFTASPEYLVVTSGATTQSYTFLGLYTTGTAFSSDPNMGSGLATFTIGFTQNGGTGTPISASATLNVPPTSVPEPASAALLGLGLVGFGGLALRRRTAK